MTDTTSTTSSAEGGYAESVAGGSGNMDVGGWIDAGSDATQAWVQWGQQRTENIASGPCGLYAEVYSYYHNDLRGKWLAVAPLPEEISGELSLRITQVIGSNGRNLASTVGGQRLSTWLLDRGIVPPGGIVLIGAVLGGPVGALIASGMIDEAVNDWLPASGPPSGSNTGTRIKEGVYYHAPSQSLRGSAVRSGYWQWRQQMLTSVAPAGHNQARAHLLQLVGAGRAGNVPAYWRPGDPVNPDGKWATMRGVVKDVQALLVKSRKQCEALAAWERTQAENLLLAQTQAEQDDTATQRLGFGLGALVLLGIAWLATRKRR